MSRIHYSRIPERYGRLTVLKPYAKGAVMEFAVPSRSGTFGDGKIFASDGRPCIAGGTHILQLDTVTIEIICGCEDALYRRQTNAGRDKWGTYVEKLVYEGSEDRTSRRWYPSILRKEEGLCWHAAKVRRWCKRHGYIEIFNMTDIDWMLKLQPHYSISA